MTAAKKRAAALFFLCLLLAGTGGGCWSRREINETAHILGTAIDLAEDGRIRLTVQVIRPTPAAGGGDAPGGGAPTAWTVSGEGRTVREAARSISRKAFRELVWSHNLVLVVGEKMARRGTKMITNFFQRERLPRETVWMAVAEGEAAEILKGSFVLENATSLGAAYLFRNRIGYPVQLREYAEMLADEGIQPVLPRLRPAPGGSVQAPGRESSPELTKFEVNGAAAFKGDRLVGWLSEEETRGLRWLKGEISKSYLVVPDPFEPDKKVTVRIARGKTKVLPEYDGTTPRFSVRISLQGDLLEQQGDTNLAEPEKIKKLAEKTAAVVRQEALKALEKAQGEFGADIFGFGRSFHRRYKKEWRELKDNWDAEFARAEVSVAVEVKIKEVLLATRRVSVPEAEK